MARPRRPEFHPRLADFRKRTGLTQEEVAEHVGISADMVRRHERGDHVPIPLYRKRYCQLFGVSEEDLGFRAARGLVLAQPIAGTVREPMLSQLSAVAATSIAPADFGDASYLEVIQQHIREIIALDNRFGGADLVRVSVRLFRSMHNMLGTGTYDPSLERDLQAAAGEVAEVAGWLAYDAEEHDLARGMNHESLYFSRLCGDKSIELLTLQNASMHAASQGRPREALQLARSVLEGDYRLSPRLRGLFLTRKARALAQSGDDNALRLFPEIRSLFLDGVSDADPAWAWWVDERELLWHEAMAQRDLGLTQAVTHFERSVAGVPADETRSQYVHRAYLLRSLVENRCWAAAENTMREIIPLSIQVASTRAGILLRSVLAALEASREKIPPGLQEQASRLSSILDAAAVRCSPC